CKEVDAIIAGPDTYCRVGTLRKGNRSGRDRLPCRETRREYLRLSSRAGQVGALKGIHSPHDWKGGGLPSMANNISGCSARHPCNVCAERNSQRKEDHHDDRYDTEFLHRISSLIFALNASSGALSTKPASDMRPVLGSTIVTPDTLATALLFT